MTDLLVQVTLLVDWGVAGLVVEQDLLMNLHVKGRTLLDSDETPKLVTVRRVFTGSQQTHITVL